MSLFFLKENRI